MAKGDHFFVWRCQAGIPFQHHGIDMGDGTAIHFTNGRSGVAGPRRDTSEFRIMRTPMSVVTGDGKDRLHVVSHGKSVDSDRVAQRAESQIGRDGYHLAFDNCEHFANWCVTGKHDSHQIIVGMERAGAALSRAVISRGCRPLNYASDAVHWSVEAIGHHVGLKNPKTRRRCGRWAGAATTIGISLLGSNRENRSRMVLAASGFWIVGELFAKTTRPIYQCLQRKRSKLN